jgi:hypothetical protein
MTRDLTTDRFATLTFTRKVAAPVATLWQAWTSPAARAVWAAPAPGVTVEYSLRPMPASAVAKVSLCGWTGDPDIRVEGAGWTSGPNGAWLGSRLARARRLSAALVTAEFLGRGRRQPDRR